MEVKEIESKISEIDGKISGLRNQKADLMTQLRDAKQIEFEAKHGVKSGDKVTTKGGTTYFYERFIIAGYGWIAILCHPVKKDGTASKADRHLSDVDF